MPTNPNVPTLSPAASAASPRGIRRALTALLVGVTAVALSLGVGVAPASATGTGTITVHVTDSFAEGIDLQGAHVTLHPWPQTGPGPAAVDTDADGKVIFTDVVADSYLVQVDLYGYASEAERVDVTADGNYNVSFGMWPPDVEIHGIVSGPLSGNSDPIGGASVYVARGPAGGSATTAPDGSYTISGLGPGDYEISASKDGYISQGGSGNFIPGESEAFDFNLAVQPMGTVNGTIRNTSNVPLSGITVNLLRWNGTELVGGGYMDTGLDGTYSLVVPAGTDYTVQVWQDGGPYESLYLGNAQTFESATKFEVEQDTIVTKNMTLTLGGKISGHVNLATPDGHVDYSPPSWPGPKVFRQIAGVWTPVEIPSSFAGGGDPGDFEVFGLHPGTYRLGFIDYLTGPRAFRTAYWKSGTTSGVSSLASATSFTVSAGATSSGKNVTIALPRPGFPAEPLDDSELTEEFEGDIETVAESNQGESVIVEVGEENAGEWVSVWAHSDPVALTDDWVQVNSHGLVTATLDYDLPPGTHDLVVQFADGNPAGWTPIQVSEAGTHRTFTSVSTPVISGSVKVGATLTAKVGTSKPTAAHYKYQWFVDALPMPVPIDGAVNATFVPGLDELGHKLKVAVTRDRLGYDDVTKMSAVSASVALGTLTTVKPVVQGTRKVDQTVWATPTGWIPGDTAFTHQWLRNGVAIPGAQNFIYQLTTADYAKIITVKVTGTREGYNPSSRTSTSEVSKVAAAPLVVPTSITLTPPTVGVPTTINVDGAFGPGVVKLSYKWYVGSTLIEGATKETYTPTGSKLGKTLKVKVTGSRYGYVTKSVTSVVSAAVLPGTFAHPPLPSLVTPHVGSSVKAPTAGWFPTPTSFSFQWLLDGAPLTGATSSTYKPTASQLGHNLSVAVTGKRTGYTNATVTTAEAVVDLGIFAIQPKPTISGTLLPHKTLKASVGTWSPSGATFEYQWLLDGSPILGALASSYVVQPFDVDKRLSVQVTASKAAYYNATRTSSLTSTVKGIDYANCTALRVDYPEGVARPDAAEPGGAHISLALYLLNDESDADHDKVACEVTG